MIAALTDPAVILSVGFVVGFTAGRLASYLDYEIRKHWIIDRATKAREHARPRGR